jgi:hypothetical protein
MQSHAVLVFTGRSVDELLEEGGSQAWVLDPRRAQRCEFLVCAQNNESNRGGRAPHGAAFLVARISDIAPSQESAGRYIIRFQEYALTNKSEVWQHWRNPVKYTTLEELDIKPEDLEWKEIAQPAHQTSTLEAGASAIVPLTIDAAKRGLAAYFRVAPESIEITIRG